MTRIPGLQRPMRPHKISTRERDGDACRGMDAQKQGKRGGCSADNDFELIVFSIPRIIVCFSFDIREFNDE